MVLQADGVDREVEVGRDQEQLEMVGREVEVGCEQMDFRFGVWVNEGRGLERRGHRQSLLQVVAAHGVARLLLIVVPDLEMVGRGWRSGGRGKSRWRPEWVAR